MHPTLCGSTHLPWHANCVARYVAMASMRPDTRVTSSSHLHGVKVSASSQHWAVGFVETVTGLAQVDSAIPFCCSRIWATKLRHAEPGSCELVERGEGGREEGREKEGKGEERLGLRKRERKKRQR